MRRNCAGRPHPLWWVGVVVGGLMACTAPAPERPLDPPQPADAALTDFLERYPVEVAVPSPLLGEGLEEDVQEGVPEGLDEGLEGEQLLVHEEPALHLRAVSVLEGEEGIRLDLSRSPTALHPFTLPDPPRLVIDVLGPVAEIPPHEVYPVHAAGIQQVRVGRHEDRLRLVLDLEGEEPPAFSVEQAGPQIVARLSEAEAAEDAEAAEHLADLVASLAEHDEAEAPDATPPLEPAAERPRAAESTPPLHETELAPEAPAPDPAARDAGEAAEAEELARLSMMLGPTGDEPPETEAVPTAAESPADGGGAGENPRGKQYAGQKISLDFKGADIHNVLRILAEVSGLNLVATDDVEGQVTLRLIDVPADQALDIVLEANGLDMVREENVARISTVERLRAEREALLAAQEAQKELEPLKIDYIRVNYVRATDIAKLITDEQTERKEGVLSERGHVSVNEATNTLVVRDIQQGVDNVREMVRQLDVRTPQVLIESNIVEATRDVARDLGIQWGYSYKASPETGNAPGVNFPGRVELEGSTQDAEGSAILGPGGVPFLANFPANVAGTGTALNLLLGSIDGSQALAARLTALESKGKGRIISRPRVITLNGVPARIESATIFRVRLPQTGTVVATGAGGMAGGGQVATEEIRTGIRLIVTPNVSDDGFVLLDIEARSSTPDETQAVDDIPAEITREANSHVLVQDGQTVVLGGVFRNELFLRQEGVPYLRSIPGVGWFFRRKSRSDRFEELLVFITPRVLIAPETASLPTAESLWQEKTRQ